MSPLSLAQRLAFERQRKATQAPSTSSPAADAPPAPAKAPSPPEPPEPPEPAGPPAKMSLLQKARSAPVTGRSTGADPETVELALAWLQGSVQTEQVRIALGINNTSGIYNRLATGLKRAFVEGKLVLE